MSRPVDAVDERLKCSSDGLTCRNAQHVDAERGRIQVVPAFSRWRAGRVHCIPSDRRSQVGALRRTGAFVSLAGLVLASVTGCDQTQAGQAAADLKIAAVAQISRDGSQEPSAPNAVPADPADGASAHCKAVSIAVLAPLTGSDAALGANVNDGAQLAINEHNAANSACVVTLKPFDTEGDPQKAAAIALQVVNDPAIIGVVGPGNSGEVRVVEPVFERAGLIAATPSATNAALARNDAHTFIRGLGNDEVQGPAVAGYLTNTLGAKRICVVDDSTDYGLGLAKAVAGGLGAAAIDDCTVEVKRGDKDFSAAVTQIKSARPDAVFYGGYYAEAAIMVHQLRDAGVDATFASGDASNDPEFVKEAGDAAKDALLSCPCAPASGAFADRYQKAFSGQAGTYSAESYDLATIMVKGVDAGQGTRPALLGYMHRYRGQGVARMYQWNPDGELTDTRIWMYKVR